MTQRLVEDPALSVSVALPAAAANADSTAIDLGSASPGVTMEEVDWIASLPATPDLADDTTVTLTVQDSADGVTFAAIPSLATIVVTGAGGAGGSATERRFKMPPTVRQYVNINAAVLTGAGDNTAIEATLKALF